MSGLLDDNRLIKVFDRLKKEEKKTLIPFLTAGFPDLQTTQSMLGEMEKLGILIAELGIPFSDPIADGPVIQASYNHALDSGITSGLIFDMVRRYRTGGGKLALVAMVSYSIVFRHGLENYLDTAAAAGIDGLIIPDLPLEEAKPVESAATKRGLANIMLVAPTTHPDRQERIAAHSHGFLYYVSVAGITGQRESLPPKTTQAVANLRRHTDVPICVGFGISNARMVREVCRAADGAIVGSAIVKQMDQCRDLPRQQLIQRTGDFIAELIKGLEAE